LSYEHIGKDSRPQTALLGRDAGTKLGLRTDERLEDPDEELRFG
jgi:hypothetical protein